MVSIKTMQRLRSSVQQLITEQWLLMPRRELHHSCHYINLCRSEVALKSKNENDKKRTQTLLVLYWAFGVNRESNVFAYTYFSYFFVINLNVSNETFFLDIRIGEITMLRNVNSWFRSPNILVVIWSTLTWSKGWILLCWRRFVLLIGLGFHFVYFFNLNYSEFSMLHL